MVACKLSTNDQERGQRVCVYCSLKLFRGKLNNVIKVWETQNKALTYSFWPSVISYVLVYCVVPGASQNAKQRKRLREQQMKNQGHRGISGKG